MRCKYRITKKAVEDLNEIWQYTREKWSEEQADRYYNLIIDEIEFICEHPRTGKSLQYIRPGYRSSKVKSHLVIYRISDDGITEIIRILHQQIDVDNRLSE